MKIEELQTKDDVMRMLVEVAKSAKALQQHVCKIETIDNQVPREWSELTMALAQLELAA